MGMFDDLREQAYGSSKPTNLDPEYGCPVIVGSKELDRFAKDTGSSASERRQQSVINRQLMNASGSRFAWLIRGGN